MVLMIKTWRNGASGGDVKNIIDHNFNVVSKYLSKDVRALSTQERKLLSSDYISENTLVFDTEEKQWYIYSNGSWIKTFTSDNVYVQTIAVSDWLNNSIEISINQHKIKDPVVQVYMADGNSFTPIWGGIKIDSEYNVILTTDLPFDGKVVIK